MSQPQASPHAGAPQVPTEDALRVLFVPDQVGQATTAESVAASAGMTAERAASVLDELVAAGLVQRDQTGWRLTPPGRIEAARVVRAHRIYETYLARKLGAADDVLHASADRVEHDLTAEDVNALSDQLNHPGFDPHGDPIPTRDGRTAGPRGRPLAAWPAGTDARIAHLEDEPPAVFREIAALGLAPGMRVTVAARSDGRCHLVVEGRGITLTDAQADLVSLESIPAEQRHQQHPLRLSDLQQGQPGEVVGLSPACRGPQRTRMLDLGIVPGTPICVSLTGPFASPRAYRVRGTQIALREQQADMVFIRLARPAEVPP